MLLHGADDHRLLLEAAATSRPMDVVTRHVQTGVKPEHYPFVAAALLPAICEVLGDDVATNAVLAAWAKAYWELANHLIAAEENAYATVEGA